MPMKKAKKDDSKRAKQTCVALYDYTANDQEELSFKTDDIITIIEERPDWLVVRLAAFRAPLPCTVPHAFDALLHGRVAGRDQRQARAGPGDLRGQAGSVDVRRQRHHQHCQQHHHPEERVGRHPAW